MNSRIACRSADIVAAPRQIVIDFDTGIAGSVLQASIRKPQRRRVIARYRHGTASSLGGCVRRPTLHVSGLIEASATGLAIYSPQSIDGSLKASARRFCDTARHGPMMS